MQNTEASFAELKARLAKTIDYCKTFKPAQIDDTEDKDITIKLGANETSSPPRYMLDTNIFNRVVEGKISLSAFQGRQLIATPVQLAELSETRDPAKREALLGAFHSLDPVLVSVTGVWNDSSWGKSNWKYEDGLYERLTARLTEVDKRDSKLRKKKFNLSRDIRIAEAAIRNGIILVSDDRNLRIVAEEFGCSAITSAELLRGS